MSLGFGKVLTALDLCADAILLACGRPLHTKGQFYDLGNLRNWRADSPPRPLFGPGSTSCLHTRT